MESRLWLEPGPCIDSDHPVVMEFAATHGKGDSPREVAMGLYHAVRDGIRYDPYRIDFREEGLKASRTIAQGYGYCVAKAAALTAVCRASGLPSRIGFANVRNHLSTPRLREFMGTDLFVWHGYTEIFLEDRWVKVTPTFNLELCEKFGVTPLDFNGTDDALFHPYDLEGRQHMEYVVDHGSFADIPLDRIITDSIAAYPQLVEYYAKLAMEGDFHEEAAQE